MWNTDWQAASLKRSNGWDLEVIVPWKALGGKRKAGTTWRFNIGRSSKLDGASVLSSWSPVAGGFHMPDRFGFIKVGAATWVSSVKWGSREPGSQPATIELTVSGEPSKLTGSLDKECKDYSWTASSQQRTLLSMCLLKWMQQLYT